MTTNIRNLNRRNLKKSKGFTMLELIVVLAVVAVLALVSMPYFRGMMVSGKVEPTANDLNKVATKIRGNFTGQGTTPYTALGTGAAATANFSNVARGVASALTITGNGATATTQHELGATGSQVTVAAGTITTAGDSFTVTLPTVNDAACPGLAAQLARGAEVITINGTSVKAAGGQYNGGTAQNLCTPNDTNTFVFTFR